MILTKRKEKLKLTVFKLSHLNTKQQEKLLKVLLSHYGDFSESSYTLVCINKVMSKLNFVHKNLIRTLLFLIPIFTGIRRSFLKQLKELLSVGLNERIVTELSCWLILWFLIRKEQMKKFFCNLNGFELATS